MAEPHNSPWHSPPLSRSLTNHLANPHLKPDQSPSVSAPDPAPDPAFLESHHHTPTPPHMYSAMTVKSDEFFLDSDINQLLLGPGHHHLLQHLHLQHLQHHSQPPQSQPSQSHPHHHQHQHQHPHPSLEPHSSRPPSSATTPRESDDLPPSYNFSLDLNMFLPTEFDFHHPSSLGNHNDFFNAHLLSAFPPSQDPAPITPAMLAANKRQPDTEASMFHPPSSHQSHLGVRPDAVFTPLMSPTAPTDSGNYSSMHTAFEPLTSPALMAQRPDLLLLQQRPGSGLERRRSSLSAFGGQNGPTQLVEGDLALRGPAALGFKRRTTPHGTPILHPTQSSSRKNSPALKARMAAKTAPVPFERLPDASVDPAGAMLPQSAPQSTAFMGFTMQRLADHGLDPASNLAPNAYAAVAGSASPQAKPISPSDDGQGKLTVKKNDTHKMAEQGRRNRMNVAIAELSALIPQKYHDEVSIPSKATTVELASRYIRELLNKSEAAPLPEKTSES